MSLEGLQGLGFGTSQAALKIAQPQIHLAGRELTGTVSDRTFHTLPHPGGSHQACASEVSCKEPTEVAAQLTCPPCHLLLRMVPRSCTLVKGTLSQQLLQPQLCDLKLLCCCNL